MRIQLPHFLPQLKFNFGSNKTPDWVTTSEFSLDKYSKRSTIVFYGIFIVFPLVANICCQIAGNTNTAILVTYLIALIAEIVGVIYFFQIESNVIRRSGAVCFFAYIILMDFVLIALSSFLANTNTNQLIIMTMQTVAQFGIVIVILKQIKFILQNILIFLKKKWMWLVLTLIVGMAALYGQTYLANWLDHLLGVPNDTKNQSNINEMLKSSVYGQVLVCVSSILVAPWMEELAIRLGIAAGLGRGKGWIAATLFFANMHVFPGDFAHILDYLFMSMIFSTAYFYWRNISVSILLHMSWNTLVSIVLLTSL